MNVADALTHDAAWHEERRKGIGGSDAGKIMAGDWHDLWLIKTGRAEPEDLSDNLAVAMGTWTEPLNRYWFVKQTGKTVTGPTTEEHPLFEILRANTDGLVGTNPFEAKHVNAWAKPDEIIERYYAQLQHLIEVCGGDLAYLSVFYGNSKWEYYEVQRDPDYITTLVEREREFWGYVERDEPPPDAAPASVSIALDDMREADMTGSNEWAASAADWLDNHAAAKAFDKAAKSLKALVEPDVKRAHGHGVTVSRAKNGALTIREMKDG